MIAVRIYYRKRAGGRNISYSKLASSAVEAGKTAQYLTTAAIAEGWIVDRVVLTAKIREDWSN